MTQSILQRIASGDTSAVRECLERYGGLVRYLARRLSRTPSDAEDATQDIFLQLWRQANRFDAALGSEKTFIAMIARRRLIDQLRKGAAESVMNSSQDLDVSLAWSEPGNTSENSLEVDRAVQALAELRPVQRQVLELGLMHDLSHSEIANRLGLPLGSVKTFMRRGLMRVREYMHIEATLAPPRKSCGSPSGWLGELSIDPDRHDGRAATAEKRPLPTRRGRRAHTTPLAAPCLSQFRRATTPKKRSPMDSVCRTVGGAETTRA